MSMGKDIWSDTLSQSLARSGMNSRQVSCQRGVKPGHEWANQTRPFRGEVIVVVRVSYKTLRGDEPTQNGYTADD